MARLWCPIWPSVQTTYCIDCVVRLRLSWDRQARSASSQMKQTFNVPFLDGIRGFLALWVFSYHANVLVAGGLPIPAGSWAVDVFMLLSGFLMTLHYRERKSAEAVGGSHNVASILPSALLPHRAFVLPISSCLPCVSVCISFYVRLSPCCLSSAMGQRSVL
jgi:hypothetical protein